ncbi:hypothetical protein U9M48_009995 [Paspalum notatum var. saurae]|uniref:Uncharacterized protein n=1 Tax=Paspalum notatum var. saurae TaxID=547442 RepID=A0AAQ3SSL8_PASNO
MPPALQDRSGARRSPETDAGGCAGEMTTVGRGTLPPSMRKLRKPRRRGGKKRWTKAGLRISRRRALQEAAKRTIVAKSERAAMSRRTSGGSAGGVDVAVPMWIDLKAVLIRIRLIGSLDPGVWNLTDGSAFRSRGCASREKGGKAF